MLALWRPQRNWPQLNREFDDFFRSAFDREPWTSSLEPAAFAPAVDIEEQEKAFVITADLPGVKEKDISVKLEDDVLTLSGKREERNEENKEGQRLAERRTGSFTRQFRLNPNVDVGKIEADYKDGVLAVTLPKKPEVSPRQISVKVK